MLGVRFYMLISMCCCSAIDGFNSTLFAYGQTGSGKTFTITGGAERYQDRGIIPRSLSYMFQEFKQVCDSAAWAVFGVSDFVLVAVSDPTPNSRRTYHTWSCTTSKATTC